MTFLSLFLVSIMVPGRLCARWVWTRGEWIWIPKFLYWVPRWFGRLTFQYCIYMTLNFYHRISWGGGEHISEWIPRDWHLFYWSKKCKCSDGHPAFSHGHHHFPSRDALSIEGLTHFPEKFPLLLEGLSEPSVSLPILIADSADRLHPPSYRGHWCCTLCNGYTANFLDPRPLHISHIHHHPCPCSLFPVRDSLLPVTADHTPTMQHRTFPQSSREDPPACHMGLET